MKNKNLKCDFIRHSPSQTSTIITANSQTYIMIPREDSVNSALNSFLHLCFDVLHNATNNRYVDSDDLRLVDLGPIALFSFYKLTTSSGKHLEGNNHALIVPLMYNLKTSSKRSDDLSIGFHRSCDRSKQELAYNKNIKGKCHVRIYLEDFFKFVKHQFKEVFRDSVTNLY